MRIPKTKCRKINVEGNTYLWMVKGKARLIHDAPMTLKLIVQIEADKPGVPLITNLISFFAREEDDNYTHKATLGPRDVAKIIREAMTKGWDPKLNGAKPFELKEFVGGLGDYQVVEK